MKKLFVYILVLLLTLPAFGQFWENPNQKPGHGLQISNTHHLGTAGGLVGLWPFNEGSGNKVFDLSGNGNHGVAVQNPTWTSGKFGSAILYDGTDDYHNMGAILNAAAGTISLWINATALGGGDRIITDTGGYWFIEQKSAAAGDLRFAVYDTDSRKTLAKTIVAGRWYHVVGVWDSINIYLYVDGIFIASTACGAIGSVAGNVQIGGIATVKFPGMVDNVVLYNRAISASEIALLYREPFCMFEPSWNWVLYGGISAPPVGGGQVIFIN